MSYLASLVARADGTAPVLRPRLASRYEQSARTTEAPVETSVETVAPPVAARAETPAVTIAAQPREPLEPRETVREIVRTESVQPPPSATHRETTTNVERTIERHHRESHVREEHSVVHVEPAGAPPVTRVIERATPPVEAQHKTIEPAEAPLRALLLPPPPHPPVTPRASAHGPRSAAPAAPPDAAPTIRVTIGRVDVRAVEAPQRPARPAAPRQPAFTLEDYIRMRREGRRS